MSRIRKAVIVVVIALAAPGAVAAQDDMYALSRRLQLPVDVLEASLEHLKNQVRDYATQAKSANIDIERRYLQGLKTAIDNTREALARKGVQTPPVSLPPMPGATTPAVPQRGGPPPRGASFAEALPMIAVLSALELGKCNEKGQDMIACAEALAWRTLQGAGASVGAGVTVTVLSNSGIPVLVAIATGASAVGTALAPVAAGAMLVYVTHEVAGRISEAARKVNTAERVTPDGMEALVAAFRTRLAAIQPPASTNLDSTRAALTELIARSRTADAAFRQHNNTTIVGARACADPTRNPARIAANVETRLSDMERIAAVVTREMTAARSLATACAAADQGRQAMEAYNRGKKAFQDLERAGNDARSDMTSIVQFFAAVKAARASKAAAGTQIASLSSLATEGRQVQSQLRAANADYERALDSFLTESTGVFVAFRDIKRAFPPNPPPHIASGLTKIDELLIQSRASVMTTERLKAIDEQVDADVVRIEGLHRRATEQFEDLGACGGITDEMPEPMKTHLQRLGEGISAAFRRGQQAVMTSEDIPGLADGCARRSTTPPPSEGRLTGQCSGTISVAPLSGPPGSPLMISVTIDPPGAQRVTRVVADNPGCDSPACRDMRLVRLGAYRLTLTFRAPTGAPSSDGVLGRFRLNISAYEGERAICSGQSPLVTVRVQ